MDIKVYKYINIFRIGKKMEKTIKNNNARSNVGCFLNSTIKTALNIEVSQIKYELDSNYSINEHIENIFIAFLNKYENLEPYARFGTYIQELAFHRTIW